MENGGSRSDRRALSGLTNRLVLGCSEQRSMRPMTEVSAGDPLALRPDPVASAYFRRETFAENSDAERAILGLVLRRGPLTQTAIATEIDRSQQTVSRLIASLIDRGSLRQGDRVSSGKRGQLSISVEIVPDFAYSFGVAILWDALAVTLMDFSGKVIDHRCDRRLQRPVPLWPIQDRRRRRAATAQDARRADDGMDIRQFAHLWRRFRNSRHFHARIRTGKHTAGTQRVGQHGYRGPIVGRS